MNIEHEKTKEILKWFEEVSKIPRCSKHEEKIVEWLKNWAKENGFESKTDKVGNIVIKVPGSKGYENAPIVVIQGHVDMVCEKTPDSDHDFTKDPIKFVFDGEWLTADKTSLGADNGIAIAMALTLALDKEIKHPPLELLFTVDEETGLTGATALEPGFIDGKILLNVDSEDEGYFTVGCAGGMNTYLSLPVSFENSNNDYEEFNLKAAGMKGGHSGIDIDKEKANAITILGRTLNFLKDLDIRISDIKGGTAHNAIPRDSHATIYINKNDIEKAEKIIKDAENTFKIEYKNTDPNITIELKKSDKKFNKFLTKSDTLKLIDFILAIPHGVAAMSTDIKGLVETSNNFASIEIKDNEVKVLTSQRSSIVSRLNALTYKIEAIARIAGGNAHSGDGYPPWQPNMDSALLKQCVNIYKGLYTKDPVVEVIHAGLECGIIGDKYPGMDMISFGPTILYPHSPDEKINVPTIGKVWDFMIELLKNIK